MEKNIVIVKENYTGIQTEECHKIGQEIDEIVTQYVGILNSLTDGKLKGETAGKLAEFAQETTKLLGAMAEPIAEDCAKKQTKYIEEIEVEDK